MAWRKAAPMYGMACIIYIAWQQHSGSSSSGKTTAAAAYNSMARSAQRWHIDCIARMYACCDNGILAIGLLSKRSAHGAYGMAWQQYRAAWLSGRVYLFMAARA